MSQANGTPCVHADCDQHSVSRGLCTTHYYRAKRQGLLPPIWRQIYDAPCAFPDCDRRSKLRGCGLCSGHYGQQRKGEPLRPLLHQMTAEQRLLAKREIDSSTGCWLWTGHVDTPGYGTFGYKGKTVKAHRIAFEAWIGPIGGDTVHHKCSVRRCFNPDHLERATHRENVLEMHERRALRQRIEYLEQRVAQLEAEIAGIPQWRRWRGPAAKISSNQTSLI